MNPADQKPAQAHQCECVEPILKLIIASALAFAVMTIGVAIFLPSNQVLMTMVFGQTSTLIGAFAMRVKPGDPAPKPPLPPGTTSVENSKTLTVTATPETPEPRGEGA